MIVTAIKFRKKGSEDPVIWKFPQGPATNLLYHCGTRMERQDMAAAFRYVLDSSPTGSEIIQTALYLTDAAGESWIIERSERGTRFFLNRTEVTSGPGTNQLSVILGPGRTESGSPCSVWEIHQVGQQFTAMPAAGSVNAETTLMSVRALEGIRTIREECRVFLKSDRAPEVKELITLFRKLEPLWHSWSEASTHLEQIEERESKNQDDASGLLERYAREVEILDAIADLAPDMLDPGKQPGVLRKRLAKADESLRELCDRCGIENLPLPDPEPGWEELLVHLSRLRLYEKLHQASEQTRGEMQKAVTPVFDQYMDTIGGLLDSDCQIASDLERCLTILTNRYRESATEPVGEQTTTEDRPWYRFWQRRNSKEEDPTVEAPAGPSKSELLEQSRMAVDYALGRLGELHANFREARSDYDEALRTIEERHERLVSSCGSQKQAWATLCDKAGLPEDIQLQNLLSLIQDHGRISILWKEREQLREILKNWQVRIGQLHKLILTWRDVTGSVKEDDLDNPSMLISEVRRLLNYHSRKKYNVEKLRQQETLASTLQMMKQEARTRVRSIREQWALVFDSLSMRNCSPTFPDWPDWFRKGEHLHFYDELLDKSHKALDIKDIFSAQALPAPINIFHAEQNSTDPADWKEFLSFLAERSPERVFLLLPAMEELAGALHDLDGSAATRVRPKKKPLSKPRQSTVLSNRARKALENFQVRHTPGSSQSSPTPTAPERDEAHDA